MEKLVDDGLVGRSSTSPPPRSPTSWSAGCSRRHRGPARRDRPHRRAVRRLGAARWTWSTSARRDTVPEQFAGRHALRAQPAGDADAHHARGERRDRPRVPGRASSTPAPARCASCCPRAASRRSTRPGKPFHDPEADAALFDDARGATVRRRPAPGRRVPPPHQRPRVRRRAASPRWQEVQPDDAASPAPSSSSASATWLERGEPIIGGGAGTGLSAKCEEAGGIDLIVIYNSGRYRMAGRGSLAGLLAYGNANEIVVEMAREVLPGRAAHAGARRRQRHRPVHAARPVPARADATWASPASRTSRPSG